MNDYNEEKEKKEEERRQRRERHSIFGIVGRERDAWADTVDTIKEAIKGQNFTSEFSEGMQADISKIDTKKDNMLRSVISTALVYFCTLSILCFATRFVSAALISGSSMEPSYHNGQVVFVNKIDRSIERGDVLIVEEPGSDDYLIKRAIAFGGETVSASNGVIYIDGEALNEDYISTGSSTTFDEITIPEGYIFVLGDNRDHSLDSRYFGAVSLDNIIGVVIGGHEDV